MANKHVNQLIPDCKEKETIDQIDITQFRYICFDYFDTLASRIAHPEDVKRLVCARLSRIYKLGVSGDELYQIRAHVERELCLRNQANGGDLEFSIVDCVRHMWSLLPGSTRPPESHFLRLFIELEISAECSVQKIDPLVQRFLLKAKHQGLALCLVSDFYLPSDLFKRILNFHNLDQHFEHVFTSADKLLTKRSGRLYPSVLSTLGCAPSAILMIGDNFEADHQRARENGLGAIHLDRSEVHRQYGEWAKESAQGAATSKAIARVITLAEFNLFPELALTLFSFIERLHDELLSRQIRDVFFLAREGQVLKRFFDAYQARRCPSNQTLIRSHYLEVSRRSTFLPSMGTLDTESFETLFRQYRQISVEEFLLNLGLESLLPVLTASLGENLQERQDDLPTSDVFQRLLADTEFKEAYETRRRSQRTAFLSYLRSFPLLDNNSNALCLVDVGWKGTIQDNIYRFISTQGGSPFKEIEGFYLGLIAPGAANPKNRKQGILFSSVGQPTAHLRVFNENRALFEVMLGADHGSAASYRLTSNGNAEAVRAEFSEESLFYGRVRPAQQLLEARYHELDVLLLRRIYSPEWLLKVTARHHGRIAFNARPEEIDWFKGVYHIENFGIFERSEFATNLAESSLISRVKFCIKLLARSGRGNLGFWPWMACLERGGALAALAYRLNRLHR